MPIEDSSALFRFKAFKIFACSSAALFSLFDEEEELYVVDEADVGGAMKASSALPDIPL